MTLEFVKCSLSAVRSYHQYCSFARGLDVVGDRWTLLVVRELMYGPRRYNELLAGLPGIATNLLAERLRELTEKGVLERRSDQRYALTPWGEGLRDVVHAVGRWARPLMGEMKVDDAFRSHWLVHPIHVLFEGVDRRRPPLTIGVEMGDAPVTVRSKAGRVSVLPGRPDAPDLVLSGPPDGIVALLAGLERPAARKVKVQGDVRKLARLHPRAA